MAIMIPLQTVPFEGKWNPEVPHTTKISEDTLSALAKLFAGEIETSYHKSESV